MLHAKIQYMSKMLPDVLIRQ